MAFVLDAVLEQLVQSLAQAIWNRPELSRLREPIEAALQGNEFKQLARDAFTQFADQTTTTLPEFFDAGFIAMPLVQQHLVAYVVNGQAVDVEQLTALYIKRLSLPSVPSHVQPLLQGYLTHLREKLATHPTYGPILFTRDQQKMIVMLHDLQGDVQAVVSLLNKVLAEPDIKAVLEQRTGTHVFLSYSRRNATQAGQVREAIEQAGHRVWQDVSAIKGGEEWLQSIDNGIQRAYAVVLVLSDEAWASYWVREEFTHAQRLKKRIIPIKVDGCGTPFGMNQLNPIEAQPDFTSGLQRLTTALPSRPLESAVPVTVVLNRRELEVAYLNRLLLEHSVWQTVYTPMAGVGQMRRKPHEDASQLVMVTGNAEMTQKFRQRLHAQKERVAEHFETEPRDYGDILPAVQEMRQLVVLGDPGSGKTTTLWRIAADAADKAIQDANAPLPLLVRLGELGTRSLEAQIQTQLGPLAEHYADLLAQHRLLFLLDGLNELPSADEQVRRGQVGEIKALAKHCQREKRVVVVTCRELDYTGVLDLGIPEQVHITPLDPLRIRQFVNAYLKEPPDIGDELFWQLAGQTAKNRWQAFIKQVGDDAGTFWLENALPKGKRWWEWESWVKERQHPRSMMTLARNPYMLYMMTQVFTEEGGHLPPNRGELFELFVDFLLVEREHLPETEAEPLKDQLAELAYAMQKAGEGTSFDRDDGLQYLGDEQNLYRARSANLLGGGDIIRFTHQLLQEFFAARKMNTEMQKGVLATHFWPSEQWWEPQGWEETAILLAGLYSDDCTPVLKWLCEANPELTWRCINESGAHTPQSTIESFRPVWLPRMTDIKRDSEPQARAAIGRAVGHLKLDDRKGTGLTADGLPDFDWIPLPGGTFELGGDTDAYQPLDALKVKIEAFALARYPVTYAQYAAFVSSNGYHNKAYWTDAGWAWKKEATEPALWNNTRWHIANHPVVGVTWYEAVAFCRWASVQLGYEIRLPTELEWERAARGDKKRLFAYGNEFDATKANVQETGIRQTSAVGMFPQGATPEGLYDLTGNVWEWTLTDFEDINNNHIEGNRRRVLRGGAWYYFGQFSRAASRFDWFPFYRGSYRGFRVLCVPPSL